MSLTNAQEEWTAVFENECGKFEDEFGYMPDMDEFIEWYLEGDFRQGEE
jgi:hypothetical protein